MSKTKTTFTLIVAENVDEDKADLILDDLDEVLSSEGLDVVEATAICPEWYLKPEPIKKLE